MGPSSEIRTGQNWQEQVGIPFWEVQIEANAHEIRLVFSTSASRTLNLATHPSSQVETAKLNAMHKAPKSRFRHLTTSPYRREWDDLKERSRGTRQPLLQSQPPQVNVLTSMSLSRNLFSSSYDAAPQ